MKTLGVLALLATVCTNTTAFCQTSSTAPQALAVRQALTVKVDGSGADSAYAINMTDVGNGKNGPATAHAGMGMTCTKLNWWTTNIVSENDCLSIMVRQGGKGADGSGFLVNAQNTGQAFITGAEMAVSSVNTATNTLSKGVDVQLGPINLGTSMYGVVLGAMAGTGAVGVLVRADQGTGWTNAIQAQNSTGHVYFNVDGQGNTIQDGTARVGSGLYVRGILQANASKITEYAGPRIVSVSDCGTTLRSTGASLADLKIPVGLPLGCRLSVIQAGDGPVRITAGNGVREEHYGTDGNDHMTAGPFATAEILVDSAGSFLLTGETRSHLETLASSRRATRTLKLVSWH